jgi:hypothetical protein
MIRPQNRARQRTDIAARRRLVASSLAKRVPQIYIAKSLGVSPATITTDVKAIRREWQEAARADMEIVVARELAELEDMDSDAARMQSEGSWFDRRLRVKERKAKMLGLDTSRLELSGQGGGPIEFTDARSALAARIAALADAGAADEPAGQS